MQRSLFKSGVLWLTLLPLSVGATLLLFEVLYRYQVIDTFSGELRSFNPPEVLKPHSKTDSLLIIGDSFTAGNASYASMLRACQDRYRVVNAGISGTGIIEALFTAPRRFELAKPKAFIYQVFVGNDLYNIRYPINWRDLSLARNLYWTVAQRLRSVWYLNYRFGQIAYLLGESGSDDFSPSGNWKGTASELSAAFMRTQPLAEFSTEKYTLRDQLMLKADPWILNKQILVAGDRQADYQLFLNKLLDLLSFCMPDRCRGYLLVIPHQVQVDRHYFDNMEALGAQFSESSEVLSEAYPFLIHLSEFLTKHHLKNIQLLDPLPALRHSEQQGEVVYYQNDSHLNLQGNRILAKFLLRELGLKPVCDFLD